MVSIGNFNLGGMFSGVGGILQNALYGVAILIVVSIVGFFAYRWWKNMTFFTTPVSLTRLMDNGMEKTNHNLKGGVFWDKGIKNFKIQIPKTRKPHLLGYIPDFSKSTSVDGRIHFITSGDANLWQQVDREWKLKEQKDIDGNSFEYDLLQRPIPVENKQITINAMKNWRETIDKAKLTAYGIAIGAFIIMVIAHLISLYIQTKVKCPVG